jgi:tRNA/rRNA methyltransferase
MAGTDRSKAHRQQIDESAPVFILHRPQLGENIGMAARAMLNCGLGALRLVAPRDGWPSARAQGAASGADIVVEGAAVFAALDDAIADLNRVYATTARRREMVKPVFTPRAAAADMRRAIARGERVGVLFGPERFGLTNDEVSLAHGVIEVPLNPAFASLNLAQAALIVGYEWRMAGDATPGRQLVGGDGPDPIALPAPRAKLLQLFGFLEAELDKAGYLHPPEKKPHMVRNIRAILQRADMTEPEIRTLWGVVKSLVGLKGKNKPKLKDFPAAED